MVKSTSFWNCSKNNMGDGCKEPKKELIKIFKENRDKDDFLREISKITCKVLNFVKYENEWGFGLTTRNITKGNINDIKSLLHEKLAELFPEEEVDADDEAEEIEAEEEIEETTKALEELAVDEDVDKTAKDIEKLALDEEYEKLKEDIDYISSEDESDTPDSDSEPSESGESDEDVIEDGEITEDIIRRKVASCWGLM